MTEVIHIESYTDSDGYIITREFVLDKAGNQCRINRSTTADMDTDFELEPLEELNFHDHIETKLF